MKTHIALYAVSSGAVFLAGCSTSIKAFYDRAVVQDDISGVVSTVSLSADRRTVLVSTAGEGKGRFCAEPPPDVAQNVTSALKAGLEGRSKTAGNEISASGNMDESYKTEAKILSARTALLDVYRTGTYALCQYYLNGAISGAELKTSFDNLTTGVLAKMPSTGGAGGK